jgi:hypothetical protein
MDASRNNGHDERVSAYGWKALAGSVIGFSLDGFGMLIQLTIGLSEVLFSSLFSTVVFLSLCF